MLELIVFCSGAMVMVIEMTGSRILAPHLGTSLIVWTSLIGVVLACMAVGAWLGGRLADKSRNRKVLAVILALAGVFIGLTGWIHFWLVSLIALHLVSLHLATLVASVLLLGVPGLLFGMVTPYVIRLSLDDLKTSGRTVGRLYALSTAGSILGTFLGGFVLISWFGSTQILLGSGVAMLALSLVASSYRPSARLGLIVALVISSGLVEAYTMPQLASGQPALIQTPYNTLVLSEGQKDQRNLLLLATDPGKAQSGIYVDNPQELALSYTHFFNLGFSFVPKAESMLMLGGGGYSIPRWALSRKDLASLKTVEVVELDPGMTEVTSKYFGLPQDDRLKIVHEDARRFLNTNSKSYDLVFVDVFGSYYSIPFHVATLEAIKLMRLATAANGALVMNVIASVNGETGRIFRAIHLALQQEFAEVYTFGVRDPNAHEVQNLMLVAFPEARPDLKFPPIPNVPGEARTVTHMLARRITSPIVHDVPVLTDAYAPVERYMLPLIER